MDRFTVSPVVLALAVLVSGLAHSGCGLLPPDGRTFAGVVVDAETGDPLPGILVSLKRSGGFGSYRTVASTRTDDAGRFAVSEPDEHYAEAVFRVNSPDYGEDVPFDPCYGGTLNEGLRPIDRMRVQLLRIPSADSTCGPAGGTAVPSER
ncbi:hypothetical protein [Rubrivirga sp.]|uniref:hypothetical protein n=1 Tax=Rubrivirga sp. TaxID=1885344 RepID=UPI003C769974